MFDLGYKCDINDLNLTSKTHQMKKSACLTTMIFLVATTFSQTDQVQTSVLKKYTSFKELKKAGTGTFCSKDECEVLIQKWIVVDKEGIRKNRILSRKTKNLVFYKDEEGMPVEIIVIYNIYYKKWMTYTLDLFPDEKWESGTKVITPKLSSCTLN